MKFFLMSTFRRCCLFMLPHTNKLHSVQCAQITLNILHRNDNVARTGATWTDQNGADKGDNFLYSGPVLSHKCQCCSRKSKVVESQIDEADLVGSSKAESPSSFSSSSSSSSVEGHYSSEYMICTNAKKYIKRKLQITGGKVKCSCKFQPTSCNSWYEILACTSAFICLLSLVCHYFDYLFWKTPRSFSLPAFQIFSLLN